MITRDEIEAARVKLARVIITHELPQLAPILERLNAELLKFEEQDAGMALAHSILANQAA